MWAQKRKTAVLGVKSHFPSIALHNCTLQHFTDRRTDKQTDSFLITRPLARWHSMQRGKYVDVV